MIVLWLFLAVIFGMIIGSFVGFKIKHYKFDGIITMKENEGKLIYSLIVSEDPELLANQHEARFKIIPPLYENAHSRQ